MICIRLSTRNVTPQFAVGTQCLHTSKILLDKGSSSDSDSSDDEKKKENIPKAEEYQRNEKPNVHSLNSLLKSMMQQANTQSKVNIAINKKKPENQPFKEPLSTNKNVTKNLFEQKLTVAAGEVATALGGDVNKTESELLKKILAPSPPEPINLSQLVLGMNVDRTKHADTNQLDNRANQVQAALQRTKRYTQHQQYMDQPPIRQRRPAPDLSANERVDIDSGYPINIFNTQTETVANVDTPALSTWDFLERKELKMLVTHPPVNYIEQMIRWTEQGRLWRFPIDNEQDMDIGQEEHFTEHIFLEQHLEGWCPTKGPIRHFMELVCVGLSKNPYMYAREKRARIMWFKDYFESKRDLLLELGAYGTESNTPTQKQLEG